MIVLFSGLGPSVGTSTAAWSFYSELRVREKAAMFVSLVEPGWFEQGLGKSFKLTTAPRQARQYFIHGGAVIATAVASDDNYGFLFSLMREARRAKATVVIDGGRLQAVHQELVRIADVSVVCGAPGLVRELSASLTLAASFEDKEGLPDANLRYLRCHALATCEDWNAAGIDAFRPLPSLQHLPVLHDTLAGGYFVHERVKPVGAPEIQFLAQLAAMTDNILVSVADEDRLVDAGKYDFELDFAAAARRGERPRIIADRRVRYSEAKRSLQERLEAVERRYRAQVVE